MNINRHTPTERTTRRGFLDWIIAFGTAVTAMAMAVPGMMYLWPAAKGGADDEVEVTGANKLSPGESTVVQVRGKAVVIVRNQKGFVAYSAVCTHLGCLVKWDRAREEFLCPCHAAFFDKNGQVVSGPAPGPLPPYKIKEIDDKVYVAPL